MHACTKPFYLLLCFRRCCRSDKHTDGKDLTKMKTSTADNVMYVSGSMQNLKEES